MTGAASTPTSTPSHTRARRVNRANRTRVVCIALLAAAALVGLVVLTTGTRDIGVWNALRALFGAGDATDVRVVGNVRLPRLLVGLLVGGTLAIAGAIFQSLTRNPLGSPDVVGFTQGAAAGAVAQLVVAPASFGAVGTTVGALVGGGVTAALVIALSVRHGSINANRLVLVGIGVGGLLTACTTWVLATADLSRAQGAAVWLTGTINGRGWEHVWLLLGSLLMLGGLARWLAPGLTMLELGDEQAASLGVRVRAVRLGAIVIAVALAAITTSVAGPIPFVALAAPQIARRLTRATGPGFGAAACTGGLLVVASDLVAQRISSVGPLPVGIVTGAVGGAYLAWLLLTRGRRSHA